MCKVRSASGDLNSKDAGMSSTQSTHADCNRQRMPRKPTNLQKSALQQRRDNKPAQRAEAATKLRLQAENRSVTYDIGLHLSKACSARCNVLVDPLAFGFSARECFSVVRYAEFRSL